MPLVLRVVLIWTAASAVIGPLVGTVLAFGNADDAKEPTAVPPSAPSPAPARVPAHV
jgi:hypothetical protein